MDDRNLYCTAIAGYSGAGFCAIRYSSSGPFRLLWQGYCTEKSDVDLLVDSGLKGLRFVGFLDDVRRTVGKQVDLFDVTHIQTGSSIDREIRETGITVYEE